MNKASLLTNLAVDCAAWTCQDPVAHGKGRSAFLRGAQANAPPKVQLCSPGETPFVVERTAEAGEEYMHVVVTPNENQAHSIAALDEYILSIAVQNCAKWFGKSLTAEQIRSMYTSTINPETQNLRLRVPCNCRNVWCISSDGTNYSRGTLDDLVPGCVITPCVSLNGIYFKTRAMGLSMTVTDLLVYPNCEPAFTFHVAEPLARRAVKFELPEHEEADTPHATGFQRLASAGVEPAPCAG
jgi:hypothetical protein